jgi:hypothetical protein
MTAFLIVSFLILVGPLAYLFGADSRNVNDRGSIITRN